MIRRNHIFPDNGLQRRYPAACHHDIVKKSFEKSPLASAVPSRARFFDLLIMPVLTKGKLHEKFKVLLRSFVDLGVMSLHKFHKVTSNFKSCLAEDLSRCPAEFQSLLTERDCIGNFYFSTIHICKYQEI